MKYPEKYLELIVKELKKYELEPTKENIEKAIEYSIAEQELNKAEHIAPIFVSLGIIHGFILRNSKCEQDRKEYQRLLEHIEKTKGLKHE